MQRNSNSYCMCCLRSDKQHCYSICQSTWKDAHALCQGRCRDDSTPCAGGSPLQACLSRPTWHISSQHQPHHLQHISKRWLASSHQYPKRCSCLTFPPLFTEALNVRRTSNLDHTASLLLLVRWPSATAFNRRLKTTARRKSGRSIYIYIYI